MLPQHLEAGDNTASFFVYFNGMILNYLFHRYDAAMRLRDEAEARLGAILAKLENPTYRMYDALLALAVVPGATPARRSRSGPEAVARPARDDTGRPRIRPPMSAVTRRRSPSFAVCETS